MVLIGEGMDSSKSKCCSTKLSICSLGMAFGITWGFGVLLLGVLAWKFKYGILLLNLLSSMYLGYAATPKGILIGTLWALLDGFICGVFVAWIYNLCSKSCRCKNCQSVS